MRFRLRWERRRGVTLLALAMALAIPVSGCHVSGPTPESSPQRVPDEAVEGLLLTSDEINTSMNGLPLIAQPVESAMDDNRNLLPNLDCLGVWHVAEAAIYGAPSDGGSWASIRRQLLRGPGAQQWRSSVVQSVTVYPSADSARGLFTQSADRWSKCTNHTVNITLNDQRLPRWISGPLTRTDNRLTMPISRTQGTLRASCEHVLSVLANVVIDVEACAPQAAELTAASDIVTRIIARVPSAE